MYGTGTSPVRPYSLLTVHHCSSSLRTRVRTSPRWNDKSSGSYISHWPQLPNCTKSHNMLTVSHAQSIFTSPDKIHQSFSCCISNILTAISGAVGMRFPLFWIKQIPGVFHFSGLTKCHVFTRSPAKWKLCGKLAASSFSFPLTAAEFLHSKDPPVTAQRKSQQWWWQDKTARWPQPFFIHQLSQEGPDVGLT